jgi:galactose mutarotase-like enzyme
VWARGLRLEVACRALPLTLTREAWPQGNTLALDYTLTNHGADSVPALWAAHPQFRAEGVHAEFLPPPSTARVVSPIVGREELGWDLVARQAEVLSPGAHLKVWMDSPSPPRRVTLRTGKAALTMRWSGADVHSVAVLWDNRAFSSEYVLAIEPSTGGHDSLALALAASDRVLLQPGQTWRWRVSLSVESVALSARGAWRDDP